MSVIGLIGFIIFSAIGFSQKGPNTSLLFNSISLLFISIMALFSYMNKLGFGDVLAAIGCFFLTDINFMLVMCFSFLFCTLSMYIQKKRKTGFLPYMFGSLILTSLIGGMFI